MATPTRRAFAAGAFALGGAATVIPLGVEHGKFAIPPFFSFSQELSLVSALSMGGFWYLSSAGADQVVLQTHLSAKSAAEARKPLVRNGLLLKPLSLIFPLPGLLLCAYFRTHPQHAALMKSSDDAAPVFVVQVMPGGLIIAALLPAVVTSVESGLSALSACVQVDFIKRRRAGSWRTAPTCCWRAGWCWAGD